MTNRLASDDSPRARIDAFRRQPQLYPPKALSVYPDNPGTNGVGNNWWSSRLTAAGLYTPYVARTRLLTHPGIFVRPAITHHGDAQSNHAVTITLDTGESAGSTGLALGVGINNWYALGWLHGLPLFQAPATIALFSARTAGTSPSSDVVDIYIPTIQEIDPGGCSGSGGTWYEGGWLPNFQ